jgi:hypothetical protein
MMIKIRLLEVSYGLCLCGEGDKATTREYFQEVAPQFKLWSSIVPLSSHSVVNLLLTKLEGRVPVWRADKLVAIQEKKQKWSPLNKEKNKSKKVWVYI